MLAAFDDLQDELTESPVDGEDERGHHDQHDQHDDRVVDGLGAGGPGHLAQLAPHLVQALAAEGRILLDLGLRLAGGDVTPLADGLSIGVDLALLLQHALLFSVHGHEGTPSVRRSRADGTDCTRAGHEGLEPPTPGFGDRCSTN